jgi:hypothetical protein
MECLLVEVQLLKQAQGNYRYYRVGDIYEIRYPYVHPQAGVNFFRDLLLFECKQFSASRIIGDCQAGGIGAFVASRSGNPVSFRFRQPVDAI